VEQNHQATHRREEQPLKGLYHETRKLSPAAARQLVRKILENNNGNVSKTARIMNIARETVRRAREGPLEDQSRRPHRSPRKIETSLEDLIVREGRRTGFRYKRLSSYLQMKYSLFLPPSTVKAVLKRNEVPRKKRRSSSGEVRHLYDYEHLAPFREFQLDTKHILDKRALPLDVYEHIKRYRLPCFEWNMMDVCTRTRFTAYSYHLECTLGLWFLTFVLLWLRAHNVRGDIRVRLDNGSEFCQGSKRKEREWNELLKPLAATICPIPPGAKHLQALVENSHRVDDECFFIIHAERSRNVLEFLEKATRWQDTWNTARAHFGIAMKGQTPYEKFKSMNSLVNHHIYQFPALLLDYAFKKLGPVIPFLQALGGRYVYDTCQLMRMFPGHARRRRPGKCSG